VVLPKGEKGTKSKKSAAKVKCKKNKFSHLIDFTNASIGNVSVSIVSTDYDGVICPSGKRTSTFSFDSAEKLYSTLGAVSAVGIPIHLVEIFRKKKGNLYQQSLEIHEMLPSKPFIKPIRKPSPKPSQQPSATPRKRPSSPAYCVSCQICLAES
jgi:hypothetical protein